jgi:4-aminobutyrate aminotransferase-like enzyme
MRKLPVIRTELPGIKGSALEERRKKMFGKAWNEERILPVWVKKGEGCIIEDVDGNTFLDFMASDYNLGPSHPDVVKAIQDQVQDLILYLETAGFWESILDFSEELLKLSPGKLKNGKIVTATGGSEIVDFAVMTARQVTRKPLLLSYLGGYHGTTSAVMHYTTKDSRLRRGIFPSIAENVFLPYPYCYRCPLNCEYPGCDFACIDYLKYTLDTVAHPDEVAALLFESIQTPAGYVIPPEGYWQKVKRVCDENGIMMIADEIITSMWRTGTMYSFEHWDVVPDIVCLGKSLAMGAPLSAFVATKDIVDNVYNPHGPGSAAAVSFGGNPIGIAAALAGFEVVKRDRLAENSIKRGEQFKKGFEDLKDEYEQVGEIRSIGLLNGIELVEDSKTKKPATKEAREIVLESYKNGLIMGTYGVYNNVLRFFPPLTVEEEQIEKALEILQGAFKKVLKKE